MKTGRGRARGENTRTYVPPPSPMERYRAAVEANDFSVFVFWRGLW